MENETQEQIDARINNDINNKNRYEKLSEKVILTSKERDEAVAKEKDANARADAAAKETSFYKDFSSNVSKYPEASNYQDKILEKVKAGYSTEDAMVSVLAKEGKLPNQPAQQNIQVAGGSAPNNITGDKQLQDMSTAERYSALKDADSTGELARALLGR